MAAKRLNATTIVKTPPGDVESFRVFGPNDTDIPKWALEQMGDHLFGDASDVESKPEDTAPGKPGAPVITSPVTGAQVDSGQVTIDGTSAAGTVTIYDGEDTILTVESTGTFSVEVSLAEGPHELSACVTVDGETSDWSEVVGVDVDTAQNTPQPPPMGGPGSGAEAWISYARSFNPPVQVADDAKREEVVAAVQAAGHPVQ